MPRKPRIEFEGAIYHVMSRGNRGDAIFLNEKDCEVFLDTLDEACSRTGWQVHAFVLMGNHYHLLLETPEANLVAGMKWLQGTYTQRFNSRHKVRGHLLQGRYKALLVDGSVENYFSTVSAYIHLNPARARLFDLKEGKLSDYRWSSYSLYLEPSKRPGWLRVDRTLGCLGFEDTEKGRQHYQEYMKKRSLEILYADDPKRVDTEWEKIRRGWCFGTEAFRTDMLERIKMLSGERESFSGQEVRLHDEQEAEKLLKKGLHTLGLTEDQLTQLRKGATEKALLAWLIRRNSVVSNAWISNRLGMGRADCLSRYPRMIATTKDREVIKKRDLLDKITRLRD
jgi:REP element-mobilizing transposase RayT